MTKSKKGAWLCSQKNVYTSFKGLLLNGIVPFFAFISLRCRSLKSSAPFKALGVHKFNTSSMKQQGCFDLVFLNDAPRDHKMELTGQALLSYYLVHVPRTFITTNCRLSSKSFVRLSWLDTQLQLELLTLIAYWGAQIIVSLSLPL